HCGLSLVRQARARTHEGTGLGVALVQELARLHGGTVSVSSEAGRGTTFTVSIRTGTAHLRSDRISATRHLVSTSMSATPYVEEALRWLPDAGHGVPPYAESLAPPSHTPGAQDRDACILIADDNADMRDYLARILGAQ